MTRDGVVVPISAARLRTLLAALLVDANRVVATGELLDRLWDTTLPRGARGALHSYVMRLRRMLADETGHDPIVTRPDGYLIEVEPGALDLDRFTALVRQAATETDPVRTSTVLADALGLWRGEPLSDVSDSAWVAQVVSGLTDQRLAATEQRIEIDLRRGRHQDVVAELGALTDRHPLRETFWAQRMIALYRSDRQAEALDCYQVVRTALADELGIDPGARLRGLYQAILASDPELDPPPAGAAPRVPRQLPAGSGRLRGRGAELAGLADWLAAAAAARAADPALPLLAAIVGPGGIGKTALAVRFTHRIADRFPDGQLYLDLRGYGPDQAVSPAAALETLLCGLQIAPERIPAGTPERAALLRSLCDGRRMVIVLDNARDDTHVRDLLPGPGPLVLVTSRSQLRGLTAREAAHRVTLGPISAPATAALLGDVLGTAPDSFDPAEVTRLVDRCAGLPLAIRVVAERMARDGGTLADVLAELGATNGLLDALGSGDDDLTDMRAVLSWSYRALDPHTARAFRLLGAQPGRDISLAAVAVLLGGSGSDTRRLLDRLVGAHLLTRHDQDRYGFHDLLRAYAAERFASAGDDPAPIRRLLDWYVAAAANARQTMHPTAADSRIDLPDRSTARVFQTLPDALAWFTAEHPTLLAWIGYAHDTGVDNRCWQLAWAVGIFFARGSMFDSWVTACTTGLAAARRDGAYLGQAHMLNGLGGAYLTLDPTRATQCFQEVRDLATAAQDTFLQAAALGNLAYVQSNSGDYAAALVNNLRAHDLYQNDPENVASLINSHINIGHQLIKLGRYEEAIEHQKRGMALVRSSGLDRLSCNLENNIGLALAGLGRHDEALAHFDCSLATSRTFGFRMWIATTLEDRGVSLLALGDPAGATESLREALDLMVELDLPNTDGVRAKLAAITVTSS